jgi:hypothetical protein
MTMTLAQAPARSIDASAAIAVLMAGAFATVAFDLFGQGVAPLAGYAKLAPVGLATGTIKTLFGAAPGGSGDLLHYIIGMIAYPLGWLLIASPLSQRITPWMPKLAVAALYGVGLWVVALYFTAHLLVGLPAFLGFTGITWVALVGHVLYAVAFVVAYDWMTRRT